VNWPHPPRTFGASFKHTARHLPTGEEAGENILLERVMPLMVIQSQTGSKAADAIQDADEDTRVLFVLYRIV
jgi:hypothetical protein